VDPYQRLGKQRPSSGGAANIRSDQKAKRKVWYNREDEEGADHIEARKP
jgi:hypothetical protein